ncbi:MAG: class I SAM-dependent methyltransferase [Rickettsiales bacterium]|nr:class I SAM-dependent methyltransferase [Rickettsiales bacterium]
MPSPYYADDLKTKILSGSHRDVVGGFWDELGEMQLEFLKSQGLQQHQKLLDIGCGALRLGRMVVDYLDSGNYYGVDISEDLLDAGYNKELTDRQRERLPRSHLNATAEFDFSYLNDTKIDVAMAQSVFTHLPMNHIRHCLSKLHPHMMPGGVFYASFSHCPDHHDITQPLVHPADDSISNDVVTYDIKDPYHYSQEDFEYCAKDMPWRFQIHGDWGHPRNLQMGAFIHEG